MIRRVPSSSRQHGWLCKFALFLFLWSCSSSLAIARTWSLSSSSSAVPNGIEDLSQRRASSAGGDNDDEARLFGILFGVLDSIGHYFECELGWTFLFGIFTSPCVCLESVLRRNIEAASNPVLIPLIPICAGTEIQITREIDITGKNFVLSCQTEDGDCRLSGGGNNRLFHGAPTFASFFDLTLSNGAADTGAIISLAGGTASIAGSVLRDSVAASNGGAIAIAGDATLVTILNCTLSSNQAVSGHGGAIYMNATGAILQFTGTDASWIVGNTAGENGGAISAVGSNNVVNTRQTLMINNRAAAGNGGALYLESAISDNIGGFLEGNVAETGDGGGVFLLHSDVRFETTSFVANSATTGGALSVTNSKVELDPKDLQAGFRDNLATTAEGSDIAIRDDEDPTTSGSNVDCRENGSRVLFCNGLSNGALFESGDGDFINTNCGTVGNDGPLLDGNTFC